MDLIQPSLSIVEFFEGISKDLLFI